MFFCHFSRPSPTTLCGGRCGVSVVEDLVHLLERGVWPGRAPTTLDDDDDRRPPSNLELFDVGIVPDGGVWESWFVYSILASGSVPVWRKVEGFFAKGSFYTEISGRARRPRPGLGYFKIPRKASFPKYSIPFSIPSSIQHNHQRGNHHKSDIDNAVGNWDLDETEEQTLRLCRRLKRSKLIPGLRLFWNGST